MKTILLFLLGGVVAALSLGVSSSIHAGESKSVALIIDASGSMRAKLSDGQRRIEAAKDAVAALVGKLPDQTRLALRAYGHQSPRQKKNCRDTQLLTGFQPISDNRQGVVSKTRALKAQGYTPISLVLELAAGDLRAEQAAASRVVVLVSDGKETCEGDPCAVAKALADADASLVVHTIGFAVDVAARYELQCIAKVARGKYFEADSTGKLAKRLSTAIETVAIKIPKKVEVVKKTPGTLELKNTTGSRHEVIDVSTGKTVAHLSAVTPAVSLPAGFYNVKFGNAFWRSIEVRNEETTMIETAVIELPNASFRGHEILDWETREVVGKLSSSRRSVNVMPSTFFVAFGNKHVPVTLKPNERKVIEAGWVTFKGLAINSRSILDEDGNEVLTVSALSSSATLPPGRYVLQLSERKVRFEIKVGQKLELSTK